jgi:hypothetical protein
MTEEQKLMRRLERKAAAANAKVIEDLPLIVGQVPAVTKESLYWRWRRQKAMNNELDGMEILDKAGASLPGEHVPANRKRLREQLLDRNPDHLQARRPKAERQETGETFEVRGQTMRKVKVIGTGAAARALVAALHQGRDRCHARRRDSSGGRLFIRFWPVICPCRRYRGAVPSQTAFFARASKRNDHHRF